MRHITGKGSLEFREFAMSSKEFNEVQNIYDGLLFSGAWSLQGVEGFETVLERDAI
jgi:hypothetical protein